MDRTFLTTPANFRDVSRGNPRPHTLRGDPSKATLDFDGNAISSAHARLAQQIVDHGLVFQVTGDARHAAKAREILLAYADRYLAYYRVRAQVTPADGKITQQTFMQACQNDVFMAKAPEPGAPIKGANSFTEGQAKDRALAAGFTSVSSLVKDGDGIWRGTAMKDGKSVKVAVDFKGNVVSN